MKEGSSEHKREAEVAKGAHLALPRGKNVWDLVEEERLEQERDYVEERFHRLHLDDFQPNLDRRLHSPRLPPWPVVLDGWNSVALKMGHSPSN